MTRALVLIISETPMAPLYRDALEKSGINARVVSSGFVGSQRPDLLLLDHISLKTSMDDNCGIPAIVLCDKDPAIIGPEERYAHAIDYLVSPVSFDAVVKRVLSAVASFGQIKKDPTQTKFGRFIGTSRAMLQIYDIIERTAQSDAPVFITGESGTGKDVCAEAIHKYSRRARKPFIALNCAAIPRELFEAELFGHAKGAFTGAHMHRTGAIEQAEGGTLFLDEIGEMPPDMQAKLLRFLQNFKYRQLGSDREKKADVRIVCATNKHPAEQIQTGNLREDLFYRLNVIPIHMPPLRDRPSDIIDLAHFFLNIHARNEQKPFSYFTDDAERVLIAYPWPGNVRQLQNILRGIVVLRTGRAVTAEMLRDVLKQAPAPKPAEAKTTLRHGASLRPLREIERDIIETAIAHCKGNIPKAAALLEISASTIYRKKLDWERAEQAHPGTY